MFPRRPKFSKKERFHVSEVLCCLGCVWWGYQALWLEAEGCLAGVWLVNVDGTEDYCQAQFQLQVQSNLIELR